MHLCELQCFSTSYNNTDDAHLSVINSLWVSISSYSPARWEFKISVLQLAGYCNKSPRQFDPGSCFSVFSLPQKERRNSVSTGEYWGGLILWIFCPFKHCALHCVNPDCFIASGAVEGAVKSRKYFSALASLEQNSAIPGVYNEYVVPISTCHAATQYANGQKIHCTTVNLLCKVFPLRPVRSASNLLKANTLENTVTEHRHLYTCYCTSACNC